MHCMASSPLHQLFTLFVIFYYANLNFDCDVVVLFYVTQWVAGSYMHWGFNKPNNYGGNQYCVEMDAGIDYEFDDDRCGQTAASYICEIRNFIESHVTLH